MSHSVHVPQRNVERTQQPNVILVLGGTGTGKSSFVSTVSGKAVGIGHDLRSFTVGCQAFDVTLDAKDTVRLIDTPGFSDTKRSDLDVLSAIAGWLQLNQTAITGVVYLHRINEKRFTGTDRLALSILEGICGQHFLPHVVLCTTMWDKIPRGDLSRAEAHENELINTEDFWNPLLVRGAKYMRYNGDRASTLDIVHELLEDPAASPIELQIELRNHCKVEDTLPGKVITAEFRKREERLRKQHLEDEEDQRELEKELTLRREALQREEQKHRGREATLSRQVGGRSSQRSRDEIRPRDSRNVIEAGPSHVDGRHKRNEGPVIRDDATRSVWDIVGSLFRR